jgi:hypothetical protein
LTKTSAYFQQNRGRRERPLDRCAAVASSAATARCSTKVAGKGGNGAPSEHQPTVDGDGNPAFNL